MAANRNNLSIVLYTLANIPAAELNCCVELTLIRERYTPYVSVSFTFLSSVFVDVSNISRMTLSLDDSEIFMGRTASLSCKESGGRLLISGKAFSFTRALSVCEAAPGMIYQADITSIKNANLTFPFVTYQSSTDTANYVYIKETDTVWDAYAALAIKLYDNYPYIHGSNTLYIKKADRQSFAYSSDIISARFVGENFTNAVSRIYMKDTDGNFTYSASDTETMSRAIVRERYIPLDRQWLSDPTKGLNHKLYFSRRGSKYRGFTYLGFKNEQLCDNVTFSYDGESYSGEVSKLVLRADRRGLATTVTCYDDGYSEITLNS